MRARAADAPACASSRRGRWSARPGRHAAARSGRRDLRAGAGRGLSDDAPARPRRRRVRRALGSRPGGRCWPRSPRAARATATELAAELPISRQAVLKHLTALAEAACSTASAPGARSATASRRRRCPTRSRGWPRSAGSGTTGWRAALAPRPGYGPGYVRRLSAARCRSTAPPSRRSSGTPARPPSRRRSSPAARSTTTAQQLRMAGRNHADERGDVLAVRVLAVDRDVRRSGLARHVIAGDRRRPTRSRPRRTRRRSIVAQLGGGLGEMIRCPAGIVTALPPIDWTMCGGRRIPPLAIAA